MAKIKTKYLLQVQILTETFIISDVEALAKLRRDYRSYLLTRYLDINCITNKMFYK